MMVSTLIVGAAGTLYIRADKQFCGDLERLAKWNIK
jgi:hypothetical protein